MKRVIVIILLPILVVVGLIWGYREMSQERALEGEMEAPVISESRAHRTAGGKVVIRLEPEAQLLLGIQVAPATATSLLPEAQARGQVIDPAPLLSHWAILASAATALDYAQKEYERLKILHAQNQNVSTRALEAAEATVANGQIALQTARLQMISAWGDALAARADRVSLAQSLAAREVSLVQASLPPGRDLDALPTGARVVSAAGGNSVQASWIGLAPRTDPPWQGSGYLVLVTNHSTQFVPGRPVTVWVQLPGEPSHGVKVPGPAILRHRGRAWVFVQTRETEFERRAIVLNQPLEDGWLVTGEVAPGEKVVVVGAQALLSEEGKLQIQMAD